MTTNPVRELLEKAARTGTMPSDSAIDDAIGSHSTIGARKLAHRKLVISAQSVIEHAAAGHERSLRSEIDSAAGVVGGDRVRDPGVRAGGAVATHRNGRRIARDLSHREPLSHLLALAAAGGEVEVGAVDAVALVDESGRAEFRREVMGAAAEIASLRARGQLDQARRVAAEATAELGDGLRRNTVDQSLTDDLSPAELAARIPR